MLFNRLMKTWQRSIKDLFSRRFTFMIVPIGTGKTRQINFHFSVVMLFFFIWTVVTCWGSYLSAQHIDYWRTQLSNQVLQMKVNYLVAQIDQTRGFLDQVKQLEGNMRTLLQMNSEIAKSKDKINVEAAAGGPTLADQADLLAILSHANPDITWKRLITKVQELQNETESRINGYDQLTNYIEVERRKFLATPIGWPCNGSRTSHFGTRLDPFSGAEEFHFGIDIANGTGTPIKATADGVVRIASWQSGYGNLVLIQHDFGFSTRYGHNSRLAVKPGDVVKRGQVVAYMGQTGRASGPHCHYEIWQYGKRKNPYTYMLGDSSNVNPISRLPEDKLKPIIR
jgi:murein DD-endopeptidase MepM/ murein hydrolase activator NlpD